MTQPLGPVGLHGKIVRLEPLSMDHLEGLEACADHREIWPWMAQDLSEPGAMQKFIERAAEQARRQWTYAYAVRLQSTGDIVGSTRYMDIATHDRGVEIGWTWYDPAVWGTSVNPECKYLLLGHAFAVWGALRVTLKTDNLNVHSQNAIRKLGGVYEGTLRNHRIRPDGTVRDTVMYSIVDREWPEVASGLLARLGGR